MLPTWNETGIALANHLWQSTVFAIVAGVLTLLFKRNGAAVRYRLWLIASMKFLVPFSLFVTLGSLLKWHPVHPVTSSEVPVIVRQFTQPFNSASTATPIPPIARPAGAATPSLELAFVSVWFAGAAIVLLVWFVRWVQLVRIVRNADHLGASKSLPIRILSSSATLEPGVFGIVRPALLLPANISGTLSSRQLKAVIAHEMFHVRRRDNLASAMHTVVEALFWFHPLVWWLGKRLIDERERACDEAVLQSGHDPADYAEGILRVCRSNVMTPACLAGVSGSDLKKRIEVIMENRGTHKLNSGKKLMLGFAGAGALIAPLFAGMMTAAEAPVVAVREMQSPVVESTTTAASPVLSLAKAAVPSPTTELPPTAIVQLEAKTVEVQTITLPVITRAAGTGQVILQGVTAASQSPVQPTGQAGNGLRNWVDDVSIIISDAERTAFQQLSSDEQRQKFIMSFWLVRDPTPGTPVNEFKDEYDRRVAYANEHFTTKSGTPGAQTDRGKMYILNGPPDEIESHPSGGTYYRPAEQGGGVTNTYPFETWRYRHIGGNVNNVIYEFVDKQMDGTYPLQYDPSAKSK
jgi:GWxTD domain-containing protein